MSQPFIVPPGDKVARRRQVQHGWGIRIGLFKLRQFGGGSIDVAPGQVHPDHQGPSHWIPWLQGEGLTNMRFRAVQIAGRECDPRQAERGWGTLYTAVYHPARGLVDYRWPDRLWSQSFAEFREGDLLVSYE